MDLSQFKIRSFIIGIIALGVIITVVSWGISQIYKNVTKTQISQKTVLVSSPAPAAATTKPDSQKAISGFKPASTTAPVQQNQGVQTPPSQPGTGSETIAVKNEGITIDNVKDGDTITSPATVSGRANVTNSKVKIDILDQNGIILGSAQTTACLWYDACAFTATVNFDTPSGTSGKVAVYNPTDDGQKLYNLLISVRFK